MNDPSTPSGTESYTDVSCSALISPLGQLSKVTGHFYRTRRYHSVTESHVGEKAASHCPFPPALGGNRHSLDSLLLGEVSRLQG